MSAGWWVSFLFLVFNHLRKGTSTIACNTIFDGLSIATENLSQTVQRKSSHNNVWLSAMPRGMFPQNVGTEMTTFTLENSEPVAAEAWTTISNTSFVPTSGVTGELCDKTFNDVEVGFSTRTYKAERYLLSGPTLCQDSLTFRHNPDVFIRGYIEELVKRSKRTLENKMQDEYHKWAPKGYVTAANGLIINDSAVGESITSVSSGTVTETDTVLIQDHLDTAAVSLIEAGATEGDSNGWITLGDAGPLFPMMIGIEMSNKLQKGSGADYRNDLRYGEPNELLKRIGASRTLGNFRHIPVTLPRRFSFASGQYTEVLPFAASDATGGGKKFTLTSAWKTADYEAVTILNPAVYTMEVVKPVSSAGGLSWSPQDYSGNWTFVRGGANISVDCADPLENFAKHYCQYEAAFRPVVPEHELTIIFKR